MTTVRRYPTGSFGCRLPDLSVDLALVTFGVKENCLVVPWSGRTEPLWAPMGATVH
jgi:hypothetical protein